MSIGPELYQPSPNRGVRYDDRIMSLPVLDLRSDAVASELRHACEQDGFFYVAHHGVPSKLLAEVRARARAFFARPLEEKLELHFEKAQKQRGYIPLRAESTDPNAVGDEKEALDFTYPIPPEGVSDAVAHRMYGENLWPRTLPGFRPAIESYLDEMIRLGRRLFECIAESLELPPNYFHDKTDRPIAQLRLLHYPPQERVDERYLGIGAHCDYECFTILDPGDVGGLQIQGGAGEWTDVTPIPDTFVVNLGEMLARWTNDLFAATPHRVINRTGRERYTIPFFFGTNYDTMIECLPSCRSPERPPRYQAIQAGDYLAKRLNEIYGSLPDAGRLQS